MLWVFVLRCVQRWVALRVGRAAERPPTRRHELKGAAMDYEAPVMETVGLTTDLTLDKGSVAPLDSDVN